MYKATEDSATNGPKRGREGGSEFSVDPQLSETSKERLFFPRRHVLLTKSSVSKASHFSILPSTDHVQMQQLT